MLLRISHLAFILVLALSVRESFAEWPYFARGKAPASLHGFPTAVTSHYQTHKVQSVVRIMTVRGTVPPMLPTITPTTAGAVPGVTAEELPPPVAVQTPAATTPATVVLPDANMESPRYFFPAPPQEKFEDGGLTYDRIGVGLYQGGRFICTGRISFDGGPDKRFSGANVRVRIRFFTSSNNQIPGPSAGMRLVAETSKLIWVPTDELVMTSLAPKYGERLAPYEASSLIVEKEVGDPIAGEFSRISHVEIVFEYLHAK